VSNPVGVALSAVHIVVRETSSKNPLFRSQIPILQKSRNKYDLRKFYITNRVVDHWNSLPNCVVTSNNTNVLKTDLIDIGSIKTLYMIFDRTLTDLEVVVAKFSE